jgi:hypothetical protein
MSAEDEFRDATAITFLRRVMVGADMQTEELTVMAGVAFDVVKCGGVVVCNDNKERRLCVETDVPGYVYVHACVYACMCMYVCMRGCM